MKIRASRTVTVTVDKIGSDFLGVKIAQVSGDWDGGGEQKLRVGDTLKVTVSIDHDDELGGSGGVWDYYEVTR